MVYTDTLQVVRVSGIGVPISNEYLGDGNDIEDSFDLNNGNVIANSYVLTCAESDSNVFTDLIDVTDYVLDLDKGNLVLTVAGIAALGTKKLYINYTYSPKASNTLIESFFNAVDGEVEKTTGSYWGEPKPFTEYFDGRLSHTYPSSDEPYARQYDEPDCVNVKNRNVVSLDGAYFLRRGQPIAKEWSYDSTSDSYTDNTEETNKPSGVGFSPFGAVTTADDYCYIAASFKFHGVLLNLFTKGVTVGGNTIEYFNGVSWDSFTPTESVTGVLNLSVNGKLDWSPLSGWEKTTINGSRSLYYIRIKSASVYTTEPLVASIVMNQDFIISNEIPLYNMDYTSYGEVTFLHNRFSPGVRNIRVDYTAGLLTDDALNASVSEYAALLTGLRILCAITSGSYDDATSFTLGRKSVGIGEVYTNMRESVRQMEIRITNLRNQLGSNMMLGGI